MQYEKECANLGRVVTTGEEEADDGAEESDDKEIRESKGEVSAAVSSVDVSQLIEALNVILTAPLSNNPVQVSPTLAAVGWKRERKDGWTEVKAIPDSGAKRSCAPRTMAPSYKIEPSEMSKAGRAFIVANGKEIPNEGQFRVPAMSKDGVWSNHLWQVTDVTRPLLSIGEEADTGKIFAFGARGGVVLNLVTGEVSTFPRIDGTYEVTMHIPPAALVEAVEATSGFIRQDKGDQVVMCPRALRRLVAFLLTASP